MYCNKYDRLAIEFLLTLSSVPPGSLLECFNHLHIGMVHARGLSKYSTKGGGEMYLKGEEPPTWRECGRASPSGELANRGWVLPVEVEVGGPQVRA